MVVEFERRPDQ